MTLGLVAVSWALWAASPTPLSVQVMARMNATRAIVAKAPRAQCDGKALSGKTWRLSARRNQVRSGKKSCRVLEFEGPLTLSAGKHSRRYRGRLRIRSKEGLLRFENLVDVEDYLLGVLAVEAKAGHLEAMKAQAVVSRTYALASTGRHRKEGYDVCDLPHCQMYRGMEVERDDVAQALKETRGEVLQTPAGTLAQAYFHASCGGHTSAPQDVFGGRSDAVGVPDKTGDESLCGQVSKDAWNFRVRKTELAGALGIPAKPAGVKISEKDVAGRVLKLRAFGETYRADTFLSYVGQAFGYTRLPSAMFQVTNEGEYVRFRGRGRGHGVGLCQHGTWARARRGDGYREIVLHYFPNHHIKK